VVFYSERVTDARSIDIDMEMNKDKRVAFQPLEKKLQRSIDIIFEAEKRFGKEGIALAWGGGRDSTALLWMVKSIHDGTIPFRVFTIDTSPVRKEMDDFRDRIVNEWKLDIMILKHAGPIAGVESFRDPVECCSLLRAAVLQESAREHGIRAVLTGMRWDERPACAEETWFSENEEPAKVNPLLHFMEKDIWNYIRSNHIPYCELHDKGHRGPGCAPDASRHSCAQQEREDNAADRAKIIENLRELGYF